MSTRRSKLKKAARIKRANRNILILSVVLMLLMIIFSFKLKTVAWGATVLTIGWIIVIPAIILSLLAMARGDSIGNLFRDLWKWFCGLVSPVDDDEDEDDDQAEPEAEEPTKVKCTKAGCTGEGLPGEYCNKCGTQFKAPAAPPKKVKCTKAGCTGEGLPGEFCNKCGTQFKAPAAK